VSVADQFHLFLMLHFFGVLLLFSGIALETAAGILGSRAQGVEEARAYLRALRVTENVIMPTAIVTIALFGYLAGWKQHRDFDSGWLVLSQVLFYLSSLVGIVILRRHALQTLALAEKTANGPIPEELARELRRPLLTVAALFIVYLMVFQPGWF
jgi:uncharacterized membrane protein